MQVSDKGIDFIKSWEAFRSKPYKDGADKLTIGYGHLMTAEEIRDLKSITHEEALELLKLDLQEAVQDVNNFVQVPLLQHQFDALVSFTFNLGGDALSRSTLLKMLNKGFYGEIDNQLMRWINVDGKPSKGLVNRRMAEGKMWNDAIYQR